MRMVHAGRLSRRSGFTIVELVIVVAIIGVLSAIVIAGISEVRERNRDAQRLKDISELAIDLELYKELNGQYPVTDPNMDVNGSDDIVYGDPTCEFSDTSNDVSTEEWIPGLVSSGIRDSLPQNPPRAEDNGLQMNYASQEPMACYQYSSNGRVFVLSAWGVVENPVPTDHKFYSLAGFKETYYDVATVYYKSFYYWIGGEYCSEPIECDHYRHSYTYTNIPEFEGI